jgi:hypothetical protein
MGAGDEEARWRERAAATEAAEAEALAARLALTAELPVREAPLGKDRDGRRYWLFGHEFSRLWVEAPPQAPSARTAAPRAAADGVADEMDVDGEAEGGEVECEYVGGEGDGRYMKWLWAY